MRLLFAIIGFVVLGALWMGPLPDLAQTAFSAHMAMHMGVVAVASAFLALSVAGGRYDPARRWPSAFSPLLASFAELIVVWTWHAPGLHHFARSSTAGLVLEQGTFLLAGLWLWISAVGGMDRRGVGNGRRVDVVGAPRMDIVGAPRVDVVGAPRRGAAVDRSRGGGSGAVSRGRRAAGVAGLLLTSMHMTLLGALLALTPRPLYPHLGGAVGWSPLEDQHVGGAIMLLIGGSAYLAGGLWLTAGLLRTHADRKARPDHAARSDHPVRSDQPPRPDHPARSDHADGSNPDASVQTAKARLRDGGTV